MCDTQKRPIDLYPFKIFHLLPLSLHRLKILTYVKFQLCLLIKGVGISLAGVKMKYIGDREMYRGQT